MKTALVLSGGGMFGAYQAGVWRVLSDILQPDLVVGASIGAINGWAIAGGCTPDQLVERWLRLECFERHRWRLPRRLHHGVFDSTLLRGQVEDSFATFQPRIDFALVTTELATLTPRIHRAPEITVDLLVASTAIIGIFPQVRIEGRLHSDGGLLNVLPLWAAAELGAERIVGINVLPVPTGAIPWLVVRTLRKLSRFEPALPRGVEAQIIAPSSGLGTSREMLYWNRARAERWIAQGERDALAVKHSVQNCFERQ
ncbi:MAG TPA: patatin-like phospholipase family protein [Bryobacteraceae bacterium]|nr:patatin-like phospholipase family protein [Bryobacteraceae bacterium]